MSNYSIEEEKGRREPRWVSACLPVVIQGGDHVYNQREQCFLYGDQSIICLGEIPINLACVTIVCLSGQCPLSEGGLGHRLAAVAGQTKKIGDLL